MERGTSMHTLQATTTVICPTNIPNPPQAFPGRNVPQNESSHTQKARHATFPDMAVRACTWRRLGNARRVVEDQPTEPTHSKPVHPLQARGAGHQHAKLKLTGCQHIGPQRSTQARAAQNADVLARQSSSSAGPSSSSSPLLLPPASSSAIVSLSWAMSRGSRGWVPVSTKLSW